MGKSVLHVLAKRSQPDFGMRDKEREKRKKILKMCVQKLRDIDDPETVLCRAVLINNTFKTLKYAYRRVVRPEPEPVYEEPVTTMDDSDDNTEEEDDHDDDVSTDESSNSDDESMATSSSDNDSDDNEDNDTTLSEPETVHKPESSYCQDELDNYSDTGCDLKNFNAESIVHSLMMPPLLSPQIEDMTNCSFYDNFVTDPVSGPSDSEQHNINDNESYCHPVDNVTTGDVSATFKFSVVNGVSDMTGDTSVTNHVPLPSLPVHSVHTNFSTSPELDYCQKSSFPSTCVQSDIGNSIMIDNLLTEIVQA